MQGSHFWRICQKCVLFRLNHHRPKCRRFPELPLGLHIHTHKLNCESSWTPAPLIRILARLLISLCPDKFLFICQTNEPCPTIYLSLGPALFVGGGWECGAGLHSSAQSGVQKQRQLWELKICQNTLKLYNELTCQGSRTVVVDDSVSGSRRTPPSGNNNVIERIWLRMWAATPWQRQSNREIPIYYHPLFDDGTEAFLNGCRVSA